MIRYIEQNGARALEYRPEPQQRHGDTGFPFDNRFSSAPMGNMRGRRAGLRQ